MLSDMAEPYAEGNWRLCLNGVAIPLRMLLNPPLSLKTSTVPSRAAIADFSLFVGRPSLVVMVVSLVSRSWSSPLAVPIQMLPSRS